MGCPEVMPNAQVKLRAENESLHQQVERLAPCTT
jgi:hypothetical protein